jgi:hypothetical protein
VTPSVSTERILAEKALQKTCGQQCIDWAVGMLERGQESHYLLRLAAMTPPYNHFEIADLRDRTLCDLGIAEMGPSEAVLSYARELLRTALADRENIADAIAEVAQLCITSNYQNELFDFYLMHDAYEDLQTQGVQWYWEGATTENINALMRDRAQQFVLGEK